MYDEVLSNFAFSFKLRHYSTASSAMEHRRLPKEEREWQGLTLVHFSAQPEPFLKQKYALHTPAYP
jgi:hypothetical protein